MAVGVGMRLHQAMVVGASTAVEGSESSERVDEKYKANRKWESKIWDDDVLEWILLFIIPFLIYLFKF